MLLEQLADALVIAAPGDRVDLAYDLIAIALFDELEIKVAALARFDPLYLADDPDRGKGVRQDIANLAAELGDGVGLRSEGERRLPVARCVSDR